MDKHTDRPMENSELSSVLSTNLPGEINVKKKDCCVGYHFSDVI